MGGGDEVCLFAEEDAGEEAETGVAGELFCAVAAGGGLGLQFGDVRFRFEERDVFAAAEGAEEVAVPVGFDAAQAVVEVCGGDADAESGGLVVQGEEEGCAVCAAGDGDGDAGAGGDECDVERKRGRGAFCHGVMVAGGVRGMTPWVEREMQVSPLRLAWSK